MSCAIKVPHSQPRHSGLHAFNAIVTILFARRTNPSHKQMHGKCTVASNYCKSSARICVGEHVLARKKRGKGIDIRPPHSVSAASQPATPPAIYAVGFVAERHQRIFAVGPCRKRAVEAAQSRCKLRRLRRLLRLVPESEVHILNNERCNVGWMCCRIRHGDSPAHGMAYKYKGWLHAVSVHCGKYIRNDRRRAEFVRRTEFACAVPAKINGQAGPPLSRKS